VTDEWDELKRQANIAKHGVDFSRAEDFDWGRATDTEDARRDYGETRRVALGFIGARLHVLTYSKREGICRVISLRKANARERSCYETQA
jgi:hypothetical protein